MAIKFSVIVSSGNDSLSDEITFYQLHRFLSRHNTDAFEQRFPNHCLNGTVPLVNYSDYTHDVSTGVSRQQQQYCYEALGPIVEAALNPLRKGILNWIAKLNQHDISDELAELDGVADLIWDNISCVDANLEEPWVYADLILNNIEELPNSKLKLSFVIEIHFAEKESCPATLKS